MSDQESIDEVLQRLSRLHPKKIDLSLGRLERLLEALGKPQDRLPPIIHIAGTNGKGSTAAFLKSIAQAAGERVHVYTSPHLVRFNERIILAGECVDDQQLCAAFARCEAANQDHEITFFEITTAAAFLLFSEIDADRLILEVGLGGRFDATNIIDKPQCSIITPISFDHQDFLGNTLSKIAHEKAGIIKPGVSVITAKQDDEVAAILDKIAIQNRSQFLAAGTDFWAYQEHGRLIYEEENLLWDLPSPGLIGPHQYDNAALAIAAARQCGYAESAISAGIANAQWPARLQRLTSGALAEIAQSKGAELWLDGGHNPAAAKALASAIGSMDSSSDKTLVLISAFSKTKDAKAYFDVFTDLAARVIAIEFANGREGAKTARQVAQAARAANISAQTAAGLIEALEDSLEDHHSPRLVICGSLYLAGEALAFGSNERIQFTQG